jgi:hypothetical protein
MARRTTLATVSATVGATALLAGALTGALAAAPATAAQAQVCDAYSGSCPTPPPTTQPPSGVDDQTGSTGGGTAPRGVVDDAAGELPFTGGELVSISVLGLGTIAGGTALVLTGRRRRVGT